jgi:hypothetical protein
MHPTSDQAIFFNFVDGLEAANFAAGFSLSAGTGLMVKPTHMPASLAMLTKGSKRPSGLRTLLQIFSLVCRKSEVKKTLPPP